MCQWGEVVKMNLTVPAHLSHSGKAYEKTMGIDRCIAEFVRTLNENGIVTIQSCCGHGASIGRITLDDGQELLMAPNFEAAEKLSKFYEDSINDK